MRRLAAFAVIASVRGLVVQLDAGERECFMLEVEPEASVFGNFELIKPNDVSEHLVVTVTSDEEPKPLYESLGSPEGTFAFEAKGNSVLDLCIANGSKGKSDGVSRTVGFAIRVASKHPTPESLEAGSVSDLLDFSEQLNEGLLTLIDHQAYMRSREETHRRVLKTTKSRVYFWTCAETVVLAALAIWQIVCIRAFFETKRSV
ncbi:hypothetical protein CTAYLR_000195 [Chrysophaeum taylorii]|uniref:GOLD domain-containing protein n=1 Tax=Chrysophaeum taylorii TaxID=2483200 RepID=A0AAD7UED6_9STRA|nr:hypothetical protein CTAYLR_000195 [Chrysophaeum taylorii]